MLTLAVPGDVTETPDQRRAGFPFRSGSIVLDLVATVAKRDMADRELLTDPDALRTWFRVAGLPDPGALVTARHVGSTRRLREAINELTRARVDGEVPDVAAISVLTATGRPNPLNFALADNGFDVIAPSSPAVTAILSSIARDAVELFSGEHADRIRRCRGHDCSLYFVDRSRLGNRSWCSMSVCGMKNSSARYRARQAHVDDVATA